MRPPAWQDRETRDRLRECEPWPCYYEFRAAEVGLAKERCTLPSTGVLLEIGCGNAFQSFLLRQDFSLVIGTDLPDHDSGSHSPGLWSAALLRSILRFDALRLVASAGERVPLRASTVDFVFTSNVLEHVHDQRATVAEIWRVLKPGGRALVVVPAAMERIYNFPISYLAMVRAALRGVRAHGGASRGGPAGNPTAGVPGGEPSRWARTRRFFQARYPTFPFPKPHGNYPSSTAEFLAHRPARWERLFRSQGFQVERTFTTVLAPHTLGQAVSDRFAYVIAKIGGPVTRAWGGLPVIKRLGTTYALLVVKGR